MYLFIYRDFQNEREKNTRTLTYNNNNNKQQQQQQQQQTTTTTTTKNTACLSFLQSIPSL
jgi:hypothetical protein